MALMGKAPNAGSAQPQELDADGARNLTEQIKVGIERTWLLVIRAHNERAWAALGYPSWDEYCNCEFGDSLQVPKAKRGEVVSLMRASAMSVRAIASGTGLGYGTVRRELSGEPDGSPDAEHLDSEIANIDPALVPGGVTAKTPGQTDRVEAALARARARARSMAGAADSGDLPPTITGTDGKNYRPGSTRKAPRSSILEDAAKISREMRRVFNRLQKLVDDDRYRPNQDSIRCEFESHLEADIQLLQRLRATAGET